MKSVVQHEVLGELTYEEGFWSGKKSLYMNGQPLVKVSKNVFQALNGELITLKGNFIRGTTATIGGETIVFVPPCKWYEYILAILPFLLNVVWGNSTALYNIIPIVGGAIGGFISAIFVVANFICFKQTRNIFLKISITIVTLALSFAVCYGVALGIIAIFG